MTGVLLHRRRVAAPSAANIVSPRVHIDIGAPPISLAPRRAAHSQNNPQKTRRWSPVPAAASAPALVDFGSGPRRFAGGSGSAQLSAAGRPPCVASVPPRLSKSAATPPSLPCYHSLRSLQQASNYSLPPPALSPAKQRMNKEHTIHRRPQFGHRHPSRGATVKGFKLLQVQPRPVRLVGPSAALLSKKPK
ncbi:hypothetical protein GUJ93_ZPchr0001g32156 [Zizania palustris]|uniref:Uncharacterized protein n=1 Tax=Zizania palustris TaxID=103762 RepID=A0A8J5RLQ5_ZIZPA|nr:hypothetical protein GUJ93_ZPchr0001g32156 [Zizania palustris]